MKRVIKFRGKRVDTGEWIYGFYGTRPDGAVFICPHENYESYAVIPETVGQFTGLVDNNGADIYCDDLSQDGGVVFWNNGTASFDWKYPDGQVLEMGEEKDWCTILGTIHDTEKIVK